MHWSNTPTLRQLTYTKFLESDIVEGITNDFGLFDALMDSTFKDEFIHYVQNQNPNLCEYPHLYNFVKKSNLVYNNSSAADRRLVQQI